ncbi:C45 family peptidase tan [Rhodnius prolixus]|uniref:Peptidase C45 hydrolase domain-containing protein n=1 Tax=Rhodnius prolixus TaxID=13249 RepID=R4G3P3_RHOPR
MNGKAVSESHSAARRSCVPMIYVKGSHYDVGYDIGRTFSKLIHANINSLSELQSVYIPLYNTAEGKRIYEETLEAVRCSYPQYIRELQGIADGAEIAFYKLFLLHLDDILPNVAGGFNTNEGQGCSTIILNQHDQVIGHNEDAKKEILNNVYVMQACITEVEPPEVFTAFCYAGQLPGYAMGYNPYFAFSINVIGAKHLASGKIPRCFATRAMLGANSLERIEQILRYCNGGVADAMSINLALFQNDDNPLMYNVEVSPVYPAANEAGYSIISIKKGEHFFHCNRFLHLNVAEDGKLIKSSEHRQKIKDSLREPLCQEDVLNILGDDSQDCLNIFRNGIDEPIMTIATAIFNFTDKTWSLFMDNPKRNDPVAVLPLYNRNQKVQDSCNH